MGFLHLLEGLRSGFLNEIMLLLTRLGTELSFMLLALLVFWCVDKKWGYRFFAVFFVGLTLNEGLKALFQVPRPYLRDPTLRPVYLETGYSFPSGHTCTATITFGFAAAIFRKKAVTAVCAVLILITMFTRMYLGVHTPEDVVCSLFIAAAVVALFCGLFRLADRNSWRYFDRALLAAVAVLSLVAVGFTVLSADVTIADSRDEAFKMLGCMAGILVSYVLDARLIHFETRAALWQQAVKLLGGLAALMLLKSGLKYLFSLLAWNQNIGNCLRYFVIMIFAGAVWPLTFQLYRREKPKMIDK